MPIPVKCQCGAGYQVREEAAGKSFHCKRCNALLTVAAVDEFVEEFSEADAVEDYEDYEPETAPQIRRRDSRKRFTSGDERNRVSMTACSDSMEAIGEKMLQRACDDLGDYLTSSPRDFKKSRVQVEIRTRVIDIDAADVRITMSGIINGQALQKTIDGYARNLGTGARAGAMTGGIVGALIGMAVDKALTRRGGPHATLQAEFSKVRYKMFEACDKAIGRKASSMTGVWRGIQVATVVVGLLITLGVFFFFKSHGIPSGQAAIAAGFVAIPASFIVIAFAMIFMPDAFFLSDAAGRRAMRLSNATSPLMARIIGGFAGVLLIGIVAGIVAVFSSMKN